MMCGGAGGEVILVLGGGNGADWVQWIDDEGVINHDCNNQR